MNRIVVLPGSSSPLGSDYYRQIYSTIEDAARNLGYEIMTAVYPGQRGEESGLLSFEGAVKSALTACRAFLPNWIIARSFGCSVAVGLFNTHEGWLKDLRAAALWGPCTRETLFRIWPTHEDREREISEYRKHGTYVSHDFFEKYPAIEDLIGDARCNLKLIRGTEDIFNTRSDLEQLAATHASTQANFHREVIELPGAKHTVTNKNVPANLLLEYLECILPS